MNPLLPWIVADPHTRTARPLSLPPPQIQSPPAPSLQPSTFPHSPPSRPRTQRSTPLRLSAESLFLLPPRAPRGQVQGTLCPLEDLSSLLGRRRRRRRIKIFILHITYPGCRLQANLRRSWSGILTSEYSNKAQLPPSLICLLPGTLAGNRPSHLRLVNIRPVLHQANGRPRKDRRGHLRQQN